MSNANEPAFTKGPWHHFHEVTPGGRTLDWIESDGDVVVSWQGFDSSGYGRPERKANAALIASAPLLFEALKPFAQFACDPPCGCHNCKARAALAAAQEQRT